MSDVKILLELAKEGHRAEIHATKASHKKAGRKYTHNWKACNKCKVILATEKQLIDADGFVVLYTP